MNIMVLFFVQEKNFPNHNQDLRNLFTKRMKLFTKYLAFPYSTKKKNPKEPSSENVGFEIPRRLCLPRLGAAAAAAAAIDKSTTREKLATPPTD